MATAPISLSTVNLDNCDKEPIHIPGLVQPHGVLLALDLAGRLTHASLNARSLLPDLPALGERLRPHQLGGNEALWEVLAGVLTEAAVDPDVAPQSLELAFGEAMHDAVVHAFGGRVVIEFERRTPGQDELASFALMAHRSMGRLRSRRDIQLMLEEAVATVRELTGFDRVMAYRFHHDDSGEIVAEARVPTLDAYLGRRFPASDIPAQARRLYTLNTLRLIADVDAPQVAVEAVSAAEAPLDLSHSVLRSVSPIHIEYLRNINVAASMSVSIVVGGRLWGLIACHHSEPRLVPYAIRMACDVLSQVVASSVQAATDKAAAARQASAASVRAQFVDLVLLGDDSLSDLAEIGAGLRQVIPADALLFATAGKQVRQGAIPQEAAGLLLRWLDAQPDDLIAFERNATLPAELALALRPICGVLAMRFNRASHAWLVLLRNEQREAVVWSSPPDKAIRVGPLGVRLTPTGSLAEWREIVEGTAVPWDEGDLLIARQLREELMRASAARSADMERARAQLLAVLGHDLRDPLQSISMAARLLSRSQGEEGNGGARLGLRIAASTGRMERLIAQVLDMSRLHGGLGLGLVLAKHDLAAIVAGLIDEATTAHPEVAITTALPAQLFAVVDPDRIAQVVGNLISNARHHSTPGEPIHVRLAAAADGVTRLGVSNAAEPIPEEVVQTLFDPLKPTRPNTRNPNGLGLGLYIASEIVKGHRGTLRYSHADGRVTFEVALGPGT